MYERMTDKSIEPTVDEIQQYIGPEIWSLLQKFEDMLNSRYEINRELRFPFGNSYGWGYKYSHKTKHLCYLFFEKDAMTVTFQIGDKEVPKLNEILPTLSENAQSLWENRYPCGEDGGWVHYRIIEEGEMDSLIRMIEIRKKPVNK